MKRVLEKILASIMPVVLLLSAIPLCESTGFNLSLTSSALEASGKCGDNAYWTFEESTGLLIISGTGKITEYTNNNSPFFFDLSIKEIIIENGITSIGSWTFYDCRNATTVTIPSSVTNIEKAAFSHCYGLKNIDIPNGVKSIGEWAFCCCSSLKSATISSSVTSIGKGSFSTCSELSSITVDKNNKVYDSRNNCNAIIETKTNNLIQGCKNTIIPSNVVGIGYAAFDGCYKTSTQLIIPEGVKSIAASAFNKCTGLTSVLIPKSITSINNGAFSGCDNLKGVYYSGSKKEWGNITIGTNNDCLLNSTIYYNHTHSYTSVVTNPTCTEQGYTTYTCSCGDSYVSDYVEKLGHDFGEWETTTPATCTTDGVETRYCSRCDEFETREIKATGHIDGEWEITKPATYKEEGEKTLYCKECGEVIRTETIPKLVGKVLSVSIDNVEIKYKKSATIKPVVKTEGDIKYTVKYETSDPKIVTVDQNGNITTNHKGTAKIICTVADDAGNIVKDAKTINVKFSFGQWLIWIFLFGFLWY